MILANHKEKKATGIDDIPTKMIKNLGKNTLNEHYKITSNCYIRGVLSMDFIKNKILTIQKKRNSNDCHNYKTIALLSHTYKILINVIKNRINYTLIKTLV